MKTLPAGMTAHLETGATTLSWCWRLTRRDGVRQGFTDHDQALTFDGTTFEAASGFTASEIKDTAGLSVDNLEVTGAVSSAALDEADLAAGRYDDAEIEIFRVNWADTSQRVLMRKGSLGEVKRSGSTFVAEMRGLAHYLQRPNGRLYQYTCDADLGDARCGINLSLASYRGTGAVVAVQSARRFTVSGLTAFAHDYFSRGFLTFTSGAANGLGSEVKAHIKSGSTVTVELWTEPAADVLVGAAFAITAGCDKTFQMCKARFSNGNNFRGFPSMPGNQVLTKVGRRG